MADVMGKTDGIGLIIYSGTRDELQTKLRARDDRITDLEAALAAIIAIDDADGISANYCGCQPELKKAMVDARAAVAKAKARNT